MLGKDQRSAMQNMAVFPAFSATDPERPTAGAKTPDSKELRDAESCAVCDNSCNDSFLPSSKTNFGNGNTRYVY